MNKNMKFYKINEQCLQNIIEANKGLELVETRGDSTMIMYKIRLLLSSSLEQMQKDNEEELDVGEEAQGVVSKKEKGEK